MNRWLSCAGLFTIVSSTLVAAQPPSAGAEDARRGPQASAARPRTAVQPWVELSTREPASLSPQADVSKPVARTTLVVDVDDTLCITDYNSLYLGIGSDDTRPLRGAPEAMRSLAKQFELVYLTARPNSLARKTLNWLNLHSFPLGPIFTAPSLFSPQAATKERTLRRLRSNSPNMLIGIGDKATDAAGYRAQGMLAVVVNPWSKQRYRSDDIVLQNWDELADFFKAHQELLANPAKLAAALRAGQLGQRLQRPS